MAKMDIAKALSKGKGAEYSAPESSDDLESDAKAEAGKAFGEAVKSGDGAAIAAAYESLKACCE